MDIMAHRYTHAIVTIDSSLAPHVLHGVASQKGVRPALRVVSLPSARAHRVMAVSLVQLLRFIHGRLREIFGDACVMTIHESRVYRNTERPCTLDEPQSSILRLHPHLVVAVDSGSSTDDTDCAGRNHCATPAGRTYVKKPRVVTAAPQPLICPMFRFARQLSSTRGSTWLACSGMYRAYCSLGKGGAATHVSVRPAAASTRLAACCQSQSTKLATRCWAKLGT